MTRLMLKTYDMLSLSAMSFLVLGLRIFVSMAFGKSGVEKISDWQGTLLLFQYEYKVPILDFHLAAYMTTIGEILCAIFLVIGFRTRSASLALMLLTAVIEWTYVSHHDHKIWLLALGVITCYGAGLFSCDTLIKRKISDASKG